MKLLKGKMQYDLSKKISLVEAIRVKSRQEWFSLLLAVTRNEINRLYTGTEIPMFGFPTHFYFDGEELQVFPIPDKNYNTVIIGMKRIEL